LLRLVVLLLLLLWLSIGALWLWLLPGLLWLGSAAIRRCGLSL
jgi:hypothetical protein